MLRTERIKRGNMRKIVVFLSLMMLGVFSMASYAQSTPSALFGEESPTYLKVEEAFQFDYQQKDGQLIVNWRIADGYYLYKKQFKATAKNATLGEPVFPPSVEIEDEFFGLSEVFFEDIEVIYPIIKAEQDSSVSLRYQGCAEAGLCYMPSTHVIFLNAFDATQTYLNSDDTNSSKVSNDNAFSWSLGSLSFEQNLGLSLLVLFVLGIGLAFTPCMYPMYPILSTIVLGKNKDSMSVGRAFSLSFVYVQGMALTYSLVGLVVASVGVQFQAFLQNPYLLSIFIVLFVLLALAMFGAFELQLPSRWQQRLNALSTQQKAGKYLGVLVMGALSSLVASPCTTAPLTAVLVLIAQSENLMFGFFALYVLSLGMGLPLILIGTTGGKLLPKAGNWMNIIKVIFGFMLLSVALVFLERFYVNELTNVLWGLLVLAMFSYLFTANQNNAVTLSKGIKTAVCVSGMVVGILMILVSLQRMSLVPNIIAQPMSHEVKTSHPEFMVVKNLDDFKTKLSMANKQGKSVMLDLYADWCVACKEFEAKTFPDQRVIDALSNTIWMQIDLTENTPDNAEFNQYFNVLGLPTVLFFNKKGQELSEYRVTGFMNAKNFSNHISASPINR